MANIVFDSFRATALAGTGTTPWTPAASIKCALVDLDAAGPAYGAYIIGACTFNGTTITITTGPGAAPVNHGLIVGDVVAISGIVGFGSNNPNGNFTIAAVPTSSSFSYTASAVPTGTYTANTGRLFRLSGTFLGDNLTLSGAIVARSASLTGITNTNGVAGAANTVFSGVATIVAPTSVVNTAAEAVIAYIANATGGADNATSSSRMVYWMDTGGGFPITPNTGDISVSFSTSPAGLFKL